MTYFFDNLTAIEQFTMQLQLHRDVLLCKKCSKNDQFVSHGYFYRCFQQQTPSCAGKRLLCSNRRGYTGCGSTIRIYNAEYIPNIHHRSSTITTFLVQLISMLSISDSYQKATQSDYSRNAYRWLDKLDLNLHNFRDFIFISMKINTQHPLKPTANITSRVRRLNILLSTIQTLFSLPGLSSCHDFQTHSQNSII